MDPREWGFKILVIHLRKDAIWKKGKSGHMYMF